MALVFFVGDEVTAAGFRLAGAAVRVPSPGAAAASFADALAHGRLVFVTAAVAAQLEPGYVDRVVQSARPPVLVIPDAAMRVPPQDLALAAERALGIAT